MQSGSNYEKFIKEQKDAADMIRVHSDRIGKIRDLAVSVAAAMESLDSMIQQHTATICPECSSVCCINRHSYHAFEDIIYIYALGEKIPPHIAGLEDSLPCQFLGKDGCTVPRILRPYRCNWYFCSPLLEDIERSSSRNYRLFIALLQDITCWRQKMIQEFDSLLHEKQEADVGLEI